MSEYLDESKHKLRKLKLSRAKLETIDLDKIQILDKYLLIKLPSNFPKEDLFIEDSTFLRAIPNNYSIAKDIYYFATKNQLYTLLKKDYSNTWLLNPIEHALGRTNEELGKLDKMIECLRLYEKSKEDSGIFGGTINQHNHMVNNPLLMCSGISKLFGPPAFDFDGRGWTLSGGSHT